MRLKFYAAADRIGAAWGTTCEIPPAILLHQRGYVW